MNTTSGNAWIWVVEDNLKIRRNTMFQLEEAGYRTEGLATAEEAHVRLREGSDRAPDLLLLDVRLPGVSGVELAARLHKDNLLPPTIIFSGEASISETVEALRLGVYDFLEKPVSNERLLHSIHNCLENAKLKRHIRELEQNKPRGPKILGESAMVVALRRQIDKVAPTQARVLIRGESGSGKELVAAAIHEQSSRRNGPFVKINCAAIPAHLIEAELFGHVRGAFTDARHDKPGMFEQANGGSLFLDEIGDMAIHLQARLLRVLEDGTVRRVGDTRDRRVDVRVVAATHCDLEHMVRTGEFRQDLYFRLSALPLQVPSLRERLDDLPLLFTHFANRASEYHKIPRRQIEPEVFEVLRNYHWPGNIRELKNLAERMVIFGGDPLSADQIPLSPSGDSIVAGTGLLNTDQLMPFQELKEFRRRCEKEYLQTVLTHTRWNVTAAAKILGVQRPYMHQKMNQLDISRPIEED
ncbi:Sigma-54-dependent Fis family transcriptional regulator [Sulfidibacter corallicola]|uniref:Sigma-54-dependent Fis family transcriptional regulator n=1 Tax=Sulfidibacter corallicola TaxID=2818388 RepID=A0A8A4TWI8_SULCO|nr:sigma-54 dependent transcriptional regulator [Sulfidibacter corallicola]QTD53551.1 sigma-54-dependent Fis family transcriptional regulator [Sulfidibacter corallicola]